MNKNSGIYKITNTLNGKFYIGSSINIEKRKSRHLWSLKNKRHVNKHLQRAYNKYGENHFEFSVIEYVEDIETILVREQLYLDSLNACNRNIGYNICKNTSGGGLYGKDNPNYNKPMSAEQKEKIRQTLLGRKYSDERKERMSFGRKGKCRGTSNPMYGRRKTEDEKKIQSEKLKGRLTGSNNPMSRKVVQLTIDGLFIKAHNCMKEASLETNTYNSNINKCCRGKQKTTGGFKWMYIEDYEKYIEEQNKVS